MVDAIALFAKGTRLAALSEGSVRVWSWAERKRVLEIKIGRWNQCSDIAASADGRLLAVSEQDRGVHLFEANKGKRLGIIPVKDLYKGLAFTPDGKHLI